MPVKGEKVAKFLRRAKKAVLEPEVVGSTTYFELVTTLGDLMAQARAKVAKVVNQTLVTTYWQMGRYIVEYEQNGADRAKYGEGLLKTLSRDLVLRYGRGFNRNNLQYMRKLYRAFPKCTTLSCKLTWSNYLCLLILVLQRWSHWVSVDE